MKKPAFINTRILLDETLTFDKANKALVNLGYRWLHDSKVLEPMPTNVTCIVTHTDGQLKHTVMDRRYFNWKTHPGAPATIIKGKIVLLEWQRGDKGPAPVDFIFEGEPPTEEECPNGYLASSCGKFFQSVEATPLGIALLPTKAFEWSKK